MNLFKNIMAFHIDSNGHGHVLIADALAGRPFSECGRTEPYSAGFVPPEKSGTWLAHTVNGRTLICLQRQEKIVPPASIAELVQKKIEQIQQEEGRTVGRKERQQIRDEELIRILPTALTKTTRSYAFLADGWLFIGESSAKKADEVLAMFRDALSKAGTDIKIRLPDPELNPAQVMSSWASGIYPKGAQAGSQFVLHGVDGEVIRCKNESILSPAVQEYLSSGYSVTEMRITQGGNIEFTLTDALTMKSIAIEDETDSEPQGTEFDATFYLESSEVMGAWEWVTDRFGVNS